MGISRLLTVIVASVALSACVSGGEPWNLKETSASKIANAQADEAMYKEVTYKNVNIPGPPIIVLPGQIKSANASFTQKYTENNIADFGELELAKANFQVLERGAMGPMINELRLAVEMGDPTALKKFKRGRFKSTRYFVQFDILKAEPVAKAGTSFSGDTLGSLVSVLGGNRSSYAGGRALGSVEMQEAAGIWIVGLRYKILDASSTEQIASGYFEEKMELGAKATGILGFGQSQEQIVTLDSMVQRLIQKAVVDIDARGK